MTASRDLPRALVVLLAALMVVLLPGASPSRADESAPAPTEAAAPAEAAAPPAEAAAPPADPEPAAAALGDRVLRLGDSGPDVAQLQKLLKVEQTAAFDEATRTAVRTIQRDAGLKAHGVVGPKTLKAIKRAARGESASSRSMPRAGAPAASKRYAAAYISSRYGWGSGQMSCLDALWSRESGWRYWVSNPNGIYRGIPQTSSRVWGSLGYSTNQYMASPEIQIKVGAHYIKNRYGTPCNAWSFWRSRHWY